MFCKELTPTKTEDLMNRARRELDKLKKVTNTKIAEMRRSSPEQEQSKSKAKVDVPSLVKAKKNEMCVSEENDLEISKVKEKKKKHKSKSKDYTCENELNNTLSLGLRVNIELANGANENNDVALNPKHIKAVLKKHTGHDSTIRLKEKTEKTKSDEKKKRKCAGVANTGNICKALCHKSGGEEIAINQENLEKNQIDLTLSATVIKSDKIKKLKTTDEFEENVCITKHNKKKSRKESLSLAETVCTEKYESSQCKKHKRDRNYDSTLHLEERKKRMQKKVLANSVLEMETEHKSKRKNKKHKDIQSEDEEELSYVDSCDTIKKTKKKKTMEHTGSLDSEVYCNESKDKKHKHSRKAKNVEESLTLDSSEMYKAKKKKHKSAKESDTSFTELKDNTEETSITEIESSYTSKSSNNRKHTRHKTEAELEVQDAEVSSNKKRKEKVAEISNGCTIDKQRKKKHRKDSEEFAELIELQKKRKRKKSREEECSGSELTESKKQKESKYENECITDLGSNSTKHKRKRDKGCKDTENINHSSENIQEINTDESPSFLRKCKKAKRKQRLLNESDEMQNVLLENEIENMPDVDSVVMDKSREQTGRHGEESIVAASDHENVQIKIKKTKKSKSKERERDEVNNETTLPEIDDENSDHENGQIKKKKTKKSKNKERAKGEINSEVTLPEIDTSQNSDPENGKIKKKKKSKSKERERDKINSEITLPKVDGENTSQNSDCEIGQTKKKKKKKSRSKERERDKTNNEVTVPEIDDENTSQNSDHEIGQIKKKTKKSKERDRDEIIVVTEIDGKNTSQKVSPVKTSLASKPNTFGRSPMERLLYGDPDTVATQICTHCVHCSHGLTAVPSSVPPAVNTVNVKQDMSRTPKLQDDISCLVENIVSTIVIKKEPGLEAENSSEVIEPINFIDINNVKIKQEPGLETETPSDQASDPIQLNMVKDHEQQKEIKKEPGTEVQNDLNSAFPSMQKPAPESEQQLQPLEPGTKAQNNSDAAIPSMNIPAPEIEQQLQQLKTEHVVEQPNISPNDTSAVEDAPTKDAYLNSVISAEDGASRFFRHAPTNAEDATTSEHQSVCVENTISQTESPNTSADVPKAESTSNVPDDVGHVTTSQQCDLSKHEMANTEASLNSERHLAQSRQPAIQEEWVYEFHLVDVPQRVTFDRIARYFNVPVTKIKEYSGYGRKRGYKHVVVSLSHYSTCLRMSKQRGLFGSKHTFVWSFKKYSSQDT